MIATWPLRELLRPSAIRDRSEGVARWLAYLARGPDVYHSQFGQDWFLNEKVFHGRKRGVFVDVGAYDGVTRSNTLFFERELDWTGLAIDPLPSAFGRMARNRRCVCVEGCVATFDGEVDFLAISGRGEVLSGMPSSYDARHLTRVRRSLDGESCRAETIKARCYRLMDLLAANAIDRIDLLSIDTEGSELGILESIDFQRIRIAVICVENNYCDPRLRRFLRSQGYDRIAVVGVDELYRAKVDS